LHPDWGVVVVVVVVVVVSWWLERKDALSTS